jgi:hypothetical protein
MVFSDHTSDFGLSLCFKTKKKEIFLYVIQYPLPQNLFLHYDKKWLQWLDLASKQEGY